MENGNVAEIFGEKVFNLPTMKARLPKDIYKSLLKTINDGSKLDISVAEVVANAMKDWALENGCTHYTHWFQPMTGLTAEKHDSFIQPTDDRTVIMEFSGKELVMGEPDASSFPSGGLRATFEARGYTAWDPTSFAFIKDHSLYIPTSFVSYTGEVLDKKTPLLRSEAAIDKAARRVLALFGKFPKRVVSYVGPEQEYFLIPEDLYEQRPDLKFSGRTLFGAMPPKGQEMSDQYFGDIREKVKKFMSDVDEQLWKLGITAKTQHNEVAPCQHEIAPIFSVSNVALDNNYLVMNVLKKTAKKYGLVCLLHEKPFDGINGSGKHNNWSLTTDDGINLFKPGKEPENNKVFQLVLACLMSAVDKHAVLLRTAASNTGNDHRLGANEAPPAIISIYLGDQVGDVVDQIIKTGKATSSLHSGVIDFGINKLPVLEKDPTDRNRTSPFAFTGNRFEFRMVASSNSIGDTNTVLSAMMAEAFADAIDALTGAEDLDKAVEEYTLKLMREHERIIFNGNGYSAEWPVEAEKRGLPNCKSIVDAIPSLVADSTVKMYERFNIMSKAELEARKEIMFEQYAGVRNIEALTMIDMASKMFIPSVVYYTKELADTAIAVKEAGADASTQIELLNAVTAKLNEAKAGLEDLKKATAKAQSIDDNQEKAESYKSEVMAAMAELRKPVDELEMIVDKEVWPVPSYGDILFY